MNQTIQARTDNQSNSRHFFEHFSDAIGALRMLADGIAVCARRTTQPRDAILLLLRAGWIEKSANDLEALASEKRGFFKQPPESLGNEDAELRATNWSLEKDIELTCNDPYVRRFVTDRLSGIVAENATSASFRFTSEANPESKSTESQPEPKSSSFDDLLVSVIDELCRRVNDWAIGKGFWKIESDLIDVLDRDQSSETKQKDKLRSTILNLVTTTKQMLVVTEGAELVEGLRKGPDEPDQHCPEFSNSEIECADQVIRLVDLARQRNWRLGEAIAAKIAYNEGRPYLHGKTM